MLHQHGSMHIQTAGDRLRKGTHFIHQWFA